MGISLRKVKPLALEKVYDNSLPLEVPWNFGHRMRAFQKEDVALLSGEVWAVDDSDRSLVSH